MDNDEMLLGDGEADLLTVINDSEYVPTQPRVKEYKQADIETKDFADMSVIEPCLQEEDSLKLSFDESRESFKPIMQRQKAKGLSHSLTRQEGCDNKLNASLISSMKKSKKSHFESRKSEQVSFQRNIDTSRSMQHRATVETSSKFQDFKDVFTNTRTLVLYQEVVKLTELVSAFQKQLKNLEEHFDDVVGGSQVFVSLLVQLKESLECFDVTGTELIYDKMMKENDALLESYEKIIQSFVNQKSKLVKSQKKQKKYLRKLAQYSQEDYYQQIQPLFLIQESQERFDLMLDLYLKKCSQCSQNKRTIQSLRQKMESQNKISKSISILNFTQTMKVYDRLSLSSKFANIQQELRPSYSEQDIIQALKDNIFSVQTWFQDTKFQRYLSSEYMTIDRNQELKLKTNASFFALAKIISSNFCNLPTLLVKFQKAIAIKVIKECYRQCLESISHLRRLITSIVLNLGQNTNLYEQLNENHKFVTDLTKIIYERATNLLQRS